MSWNNRTVAGALAALALSAGCVDNRDVPAELTEARQDLLEVIDLQPLPGMDGPRLSTERVKGAPLYLVASGRLDRAIDEAAASLGAEVASAGFTPVTAAGAGEEQRPGGGKVVAAVRGKVVAEMTLYEKLGSLPAQPSSTYVQTRLAERHPKLLWTQVDRR